MLLLVAASAAQTGLSGSVYAADGQAVYVKVCKICHERGMAGAPLTGNAEAWKDRLAKGKDVLYDHAINGFRGKGVMPPKGGNKKLSDEEVKAAVDFMTTFP